MKNILLILIFIIPSLAFGQGIITKEEAKVRAVSQIKMLKNGKLIVRLHSNESTIKLLKKKGMIKRALYIKEQQEKLNKTIVKAFDEFKFCKVYFFYSDFSKSIESENYSKVKLLDSSLKSVSLNLDSNFLVADFGEMGGINKMNIESMYLLDNKLRLLNKPFPFYVRFHPTPIQSLSHKKVVTRMDKKLAKFYGSK